MSNPNRQTNEICANFLENQEGNVWKELLYHMLPYSPHPLLAGPANNVSAAALWSYIKVWKESFRQAKAEKGKILVLTLEPSPAWVIVLLSALWEDLTILLCKEEELDDFSLKNYFATVSSANEKSTWRVSDHLEPRLQNPPNENSILDFQHRILFSKRFELQGITDKDLIRFLNTLNFKEKGEAVLSTMDYANPLGLLYDFLVSFFQCREIFFSQSLEEGEILNRFDSFEIDHLVCEHSKTNYYQMLKHQSKRNKSFESIVSFPSGLNIQNLLLLLDRDFTLPEKRNSTI